MRSATARSRVSPSASPSVPISANKVSQLSNSQSVQSGVPRVERGLPRCCSCPRSAWLCGGGAHVREPCTVFNAVTRGRRAVASVASHDSKPSLRGVSGAWRWTSIRLFPALTDPGQRDMRTCLGPRPGCAVALAAVRIVSTVSFVLAMSIRPRAPHGRVGSRRPATRPHSTAHTGHGGQSPSAVRPGGVRVVRASRPSGSAFVGLRGL